MAIYLVGDIQGCYKELTALLSQVNFDTTKDTLYLAGDLVARGPDSLDTLRLIKSLGKSAKVVLGNHDLHLLAVHAGIKKAKISDNLDDLLAAPDVDELMDWLAEQPLLQKIPNAKFLSNDGNKIKNKGNKKTTDIAKNAYMSHAGISPQWGLSEAKKQAKFIQQRLAGDSREHWLSLMYGEEPNSWLEAKTEIEKFRFSINAFTRMRYCFEDGSLEFTQKKAPDKNENINSLPTEVQPLITPWFELSTTINKTPWIFGHWASLMGNVAHPNIYPLDTGCVWGNHLTMLRWHDKKYFTQSAINKD
ncbi:symmetrical bis(5'-nucleosyl)-tetraphosphatase [Colwellia sp. E2M01]|uniref:symmetrical bis(5'-nucleosyl)-tetraphosphatase n=1 Tax=Colwellia sp. E2M01 TaxID=2841561 RepID=UPI001C081E9A|nr:symmetrical bis(5'-nucleosyl)-tetraphosphatase [Colwellia sp. E2M01]MBU2870266.1 symmetrical bis(5'-nucleosyl)-tetraphosphatase [Colwellia sp. E2M01]